MDAVELSVGSDCPHEIGRRMRQSQAPGVAVGYSFCCQPVSALRDLILEFAERADQRRVADVGSRCDEAHDVR